MKYTLTLTEQEVNEILDWISDTDDTPVCPIPEDVVPYLNTMKGRSIMTRLLLGIKIDPNNKS